jgi:hypothetical protein
MKLALASFQQNNNLGDLGGVVECPRIEPKRAQVCRLAPDLPAGTRLEGVPPTSQVLVPLPATRCEKTWAQSRRPLYTVRSWEGKMEIPA